jgi:hypothetical protein
MTRTTRILFIALLPSLAASLVPTAQATSWPPPRIPLGSYQQSCDPGSITFDGTKLSAHCPDGTGRWFTTTLVTISCSGDISNVYGQLYCNGGWPGGSYWDTCDPVSYTIDSSGHTRLDATCWDGGHWQDSSLTWEEFPIVGNPGPCLSEPVNVLGHLSCDEPGVGLVLSPQGSYRASCGPVMYNNGSYPHYPYGDTLYAYCRRMDGTWYVTNLKNPYSCKGDISNNNGRLTCPK